MSTERPTQSDRELWRSLATDRRINARRVTAQQGLLCRLIDAFAFQHGGRVVEKVAVNLGLGRELGKEIQNIITHYGNSIP